jgi:hypothetical protein
MNPLLLYMDEDIMEDALVRGLRARGLDLLLVSEAGRQNCSDEDQLVYATITGRVLGSYNVHDYARLHVEWIASGQSHCGLILMEQQRYSLGEEIRMLVRFANFTEMAAMRNRIVYLNAGLVAD